MFIYNPNHNPNPNSRTITGPWVIYKLGSLRPHSMKIEETKKNKKNRKKQNSPLKKKKLNKEDKPLFVRAPPLPKLISKKKK